MQLLVRNTCEAMPRHFDDVVVVDDYGGSGTVVMMTTTTTTMMMMMMMLMMLLLLMMMMMFTVIIMLASCTTGMKVHSSKPFGGAGSSRFCAACCAGGLLVHRYDPAGTSVAQLSSNTGRLFVLSATTYAGRYLSRLPTKQSHTGKNDCKPRFLGVSIASARSTARYPRIKTTTNLSLKFTGRGENNINSNHS